MQGEALEYSLEEEAWMEFARTEERRTMDLVRDSAKMLVPFYGVMSSLYAALIVLSRDRPINAMPLFMWLFGLCLAMIAIMPMPWKPARDEPDAIRDEFKRLADLKSGLAWLAVGVGVIASTVAAASIVQAMP